MNNIIPSQADLRIRAYQLFENEYMAEQWIKNSLWLYKTGKHVLLTGKYPFKETKNA